MKILVIISTVDLKYRLGCTPSWWQLLKALHETGNEVVVIPYLGRSVRSLWWRTYENPCTRESIILNSYLEQKKKKGKSPAKRDLLSPVARGIINHYIRPKWKRYLLNILRKEKNFDVVLFMSVPLNQITGIPTEIKKQLGVPVAYYDGDMPTILPKYATDRGFKFDYYEGANLSEYDAFFTNSKGVISDLIDMGAENVHPLYYAVDLALFSPVNIKKDIDVSFFGYGSDFREEWMEKMITCPSKKMQGVNFSVGGGNFAMDLGRAKLVGDLSYSEFRRFCCGSKIALNITRWSHASVYASSTSRPFELAAFACCIVSQPYNGIEEWFDLGKEIIVVKSEEEAIESYKWLLSDDKKREMVGKQARKRVLKEHAYQCRVRELVKILNTLTT